MKIFIFHVTAGHGHKKAAEALKESFGAEDAGGKHDVRLFDALEHTSPSFGRSYSYAYFMLVKYMPWIWGFFYLFTDKLVPWAFLSFFRKCNSRLNARPLEKLLRAEDPDVILCTHFLPAEIASRLKREGKIRSKVGVVVTDFFVHRFWVNHGTDFYIGMCEETRKALLAMKVEGSRIHLLGIPVSKKFSKPVDPLKVLTKLGLEENRFTVLISSGSFGSGPIRSVVKMLEKFKQKIQVIVVCGINQTLQTVLKGMKTGFPFAALGYVDNMDELMAVSNVIVGRPSGLTTSESLARGVPLIIISEIPGQESLNRSVLLRAKASFSAASENEFVDLIGELIDRPDRINEVRHAIQKIAKPNAASDIVKLVMSENT